MQSINQSTKIISPNQIIITVCKRCEKLFGHLHQQRHAVLLINQSDQHLEQGTLLSSLNAIAKQPLLNHIKV